MRRWGISGPLSALSVLGPAALLVPAACGGDAEKRPPTAQPETAAESVAAVDGM